MLSINPKGRGKNARTMSIMHRKSTVAASMTLDDIL